MNAHAPALTREEVRLKVYGKAGVDALDFFGRAKPLPLFVRFALMTSRWARPYAYRSLHELALAIHRRREGETLELWAARLPVQAPNDDSVVEMRVIEVRAVSEGRRPRLIGYAYVGVHDDSLRLLRTALKSIAPDGITDA